MAPLTPNEQGIRGGFVEAAMERLPRCGECDLQVAFYGHFGDIPTHLGPDPDSTHLAVEANKDHDPILVWWRPTNIKGD